MKVKESHFPKRGSPPDLEPLTSDTFGGLESVYRDYHDQLLRFLTARIGNQEDALDTLQEMWIKLRIKPSGPISNAKAYLFRMAQNLVVDRARAQQRRMHRDRIWLDERTQAFSGTTEIVSRDEQNAESTLLEQEELQRLTLALETLPEGARRVFELHKIEGLSHAEVAAHLHISQSGVEKHMAVAMKYLRRALLD